MNFLVLLMLSLGLFLNVNAAEEIIPSCSKEGSVYCPSGYAPSCPSDEKKSKPQCVFVDGKYVAGCYWFEKNEKINFAINNLPKDKMKVNAVGDAKVFKLDMETIKCRKI